MGAGNSRVLMPQRVLYYCLWFVSGLVACGSLLDAFSKASILPLRVIIVTTLGMVSVWVTLECLMRFGYIKWKTTDGKVVIHRRLGWALRLPLLGAIAVLWIPYLVVDSGSSQTTVSQSILEIRAILLGLVERLGQKLPTAESVPSQPQMSSELSDIATKHKVPPDSLNQRVEEFERWTRERGPSASQYLDKALVHFNKRQFAEAGVNGEASALWAARTPGHVESAMEIAIRRRTEIDAWRVAAVSYMLAGKIPKAAETSAKWFETVDLDKATDENMAAAFFRLFVLAANNQTEDFDALFRRLRSMSTQIFKEWKFDAAAFGAEVREFAKAIAGGDPSFEPHRYPQISQFVSKAREVVSTMGVTRDESHISNAIGTVLTLSGHPDEAIGYVEFEVERAKKNHGEMSSTVGNLLRFTASWKKLRGRTKEAIGDYQRALTILETIEGGKSEGVGYTLSGLADALDQLGRSTEANEYRRRSVEILGDPSSRRETAVNLVNTLLSLSTNQTDGDAIAKQMQMSGIKLLEEGNAVEAERFLVLALKRYEARPSLTSDIRLVKMNIAAAHILQGAPERAKAELEALLKQIGPTSEGNALLSGRCNYYLARCYTLLKQPEKAVSLLQKSFTAYSLAKGNVPANFAKDSRDALAEIESPTPSP